MDRSRTPRHASRPVVGVIGGGQLARMLQAPATALGVELRVLAGAGDEAAAGVVPHTVGGGWDDLDRLDAFATGCDVVTLDHEKVDPALLDELASRHHRVLPSPSAVRLAADKAAMRTGLGARGLPMPDHVVVRCPADLATAGARFGWPLVLKATRGAYDGRGVWIVESPSSAAGHLARAGDQALLAEPLLAIERELAVLVARRADGVHVVYPTVETVQVDGICHRVLTPAPVHPALAATAQAVAVEAAEAVDAVGILAVELFVVDGRILVNELAPRPHNSGHVTIDANVTCQFENHLRAILDWPLGDPRLRVPAAAMANVLGNPFGTDPAQHLGDVLALPDVHPHLYGKRPRHGRKLGHVTACADDLEVASARATLAADLLTCPCSEADPAGGQRGCLTSGPPPLPRPDATDPTVGVRP